MGEITSLEQIEAMETEEIEARMAEICEAYCDVVIGRYVSKSEVPAFIIPTTSDFSRLSKAEDLPPFTLELVLAFLNDSSDRFTSGKIEEKYVIKFYDLLNAVAKNKTATVEVLEAIVDEMEHLSGEGLGVDFTQYMVAMAIIRHERCTKKMLDALISFGLYCRNLVLCIEIEGDDLVTLIVENPNTSIETLKRVRAYQIERFGEPEKKADDEEEMDLYDESVVDAIDRVLKERWMEVKQLENQSLYNDPDQYELF